MGILVDFAEESSDGKTLIVEVSEDDAGVVPVGIDPSQVARRATVSFDASLDLIQGIASRSVASIRAMPVQPDEFKLDFSVKFVADVGAVLAKAGGEANLAVSMTWRPTKDQD